MVFSSERGTTLIVVVVATVALAALGIGVLTLGLFETDASRKELASRQARVAAGSALDLVKHWFDAPAGASGEWLVPRAEEVDRAQRRVDPDGDGSSQPYSTASPPWNVVYRQGRDDLFERPFAGAPVLTLEGDTPGPDLAIAEDSPTAAVRGFLARLNTEMFPAGPAPGLALRIRTIAVYRAPRVRIDGLMRRIGFATIDVSAAVVRTTGETETVLASARASGVLQEIPYAQPGPLSTAGNIENGQGLDLRWGETGASGGVSFGGDPRASVHGGWPWRSFTRHLSADADGDGTNDDTDADGTTDLDEWLALPDTTLEDPWFALLAGGAIAGAPDGTLQPYPFNPGAIPGTYATDDDRSGVFQGLGSGFVAPPDAPVFRAVAASGGPAVHLFRYVPGSVPPLFREGAGGPIEFESATRNGEGLFFFDTADSLPPRDDDGDGTFDNLTPSIVVSDPGWWASGCLFVNASSLTLPASDRPAYEWIAPPGEPIDDADADGTCGEGESFLELIYPSDPLAPGSGFERRAVRACGGSLYPAAHGPSVRVPLTLAGLVLTMGSLTGGAGARIYGSIAAGAGVTGPPLATPLQVLYDSRLAHDGWPAHAARLPRTVWQRRSVSP